MGNAVRHFFGSHTILGFISYHRLMPLLFLGRRIFALMVRVLLFRRKSRTPAGVLAGTDRDTEMHGLEECLRIPAEEFSHPAPGCHAPPPHWKFGVKFANPSVRLLHLDNAEYIGPEAYARSRDNLLVLDLSRFFYGNHFLHPARSIPFIPEPDFLPGTTAVLSQAGAASYFHWLYEVLPKFKLFRDAGISFDRLLVDPVFPFQEETLSLAGFGDFPVVRLRPGAGYLCESSYAVTRTRTVSPWRIGFVRDLFSPVISGIRPKGRRLYISRNNAGRRRVLNEPEVMDLLTRSGFEIADPEGMSVADQARLFAEASCIVAPHGGALSNIVFSAPGTVLIELFSPGYVNCCFWEISSMSGISYYYLTGEGRSFGSWDPHLVYADMKIDIDKLAGLLRRTGLE